MAAWSKLMEISLPYNCYEVIHTWEPDCNMAALTGGGHAFHEALKIYAPLYLVTYLLKRRFTWESAIHTLRNLFISSSFLGYYAFYLNLFYCLTRKLMGAYYNIICSFFPAFLASMLCYFVERKNRRRTLAIYLANAATETAIRMVISRGIVSPFRNAEVYLFSSTMAVFFLFLKRWGFREDAVCNAIRFLFGEDEAKREDKKRNKKRMPVATKELGLENLFSKILPLKDVMRATYLRTICSAKHASCNHASSCTMYCLVGFLRPFLLGYLASVTMRCLSMRKQLKLHPYRLLSVLTQKNCFNLGLFLGGFGGTFKVVNCFLRWSVGKDLLVNAIPAGFLGGLFMKFFPSPTLSLYMLWKLMELTYISGIEVGVLPNVKGFLPLLLSFSTALLFHVAAVEPHNLKPSYFKFLKRISYNRISLINRRTLDILGTQASKLKPDFWPELDHRYTSQQFKDSTLLWLIP